ncbi:MAG: hypothetical protein K0S20_442, partial [Patescibacteria group bacterium]|nr:hypothetical protein [Patescibacteria group bacterium]
MNREESRPTLSEHINRLQQRQLELVQQTNSELEMLRKQVEDTESAEQRLAAEKEPLLAEIQELRSSVRYLEEERSEQARQYQELRAQMDSYAAHIRNIAESLSSNLPSLPMEMEPTKNALVKKAPAPLPLVRPEPLPSLPAKRKPAGGIVRKLVPKRGAMVRFALLALVATGGYAGWNSLTGATPADTGQVAGVSTATTTATSSSSESTLPDYAQSFAELPFDETQWQKTTDPEFGIVIDYP